MNETQQMFCLLSAMPHEPHGGRLAWVSGFHGNRFWAYVELMAYMVLTISTVLVAILPS